jgi:intracellular sulfur oxidation DsrE/DsrF family protein
MRKSLPFIFVLFFMASASALEVVPVQEPSPRYIAHIQLNTAAELEGVLQRADQLFISGQFMVGKDAPIVFVLHGPEANVFFQGNYTKNKTLVDLAARLTAFQIVDIKVCETWMGGEGLNKRELPPFVSAVPYGPGEARRLLEEENYIYF